MNSWPSTIPVSPYRIEVEGAFFRIIFPYNPTLVSAVKEIHSRKFDSSLKLWRTTMEPMACVHLNNFLQAHPEFVVSPEAQKELDNVQGKIDEWHAEQERIKQQKARNLEAAKAVDAEVSIPGLGGELRPFQRAGVAYAVANKRVFIGDEPGLGKTCQALATIQATNAYPAIVVCPATLKINWLREARKWLPDKKVRILQSRSSFYDGDILIINYDVLHRHIQGLRNRNPQAIVFDESHYCFVGDTPVLTDRGWIAIRDIVENRLSVHVASIDLSHDVLEWKPITGFFKNKLHQFLIKVTHEHGEFICTANHRIWTQNGYVEAAALAHGTELRMVSSVIPDAEKRESDCPFLFLPLLGQREKFKTGSQSRHQCGIEQTAGSKNMRLVQDRIFNTAMRPSVEEAEILRDIMCRQMEAGAAGAHGNIHAGCQIDARIESGPKTSRCISQDESQQSHEQSSDDRENASEKDRAHIPQSWREWKNYRTSAAVVRVPEPANGACYFNIAGQRPVSFITDMLQSRFGYPAQEDSHRSGREQSQHQALEISGQAQNGNLASSRVVSVEIYEPTGDGADKGRTGYPAHVYDIEVQDNHNYFAGGVLVSNCKNHKAKRTETAQALVDGVSTVLCLTGTPIMNRPQELVSQLKILGRLEEFGGWYNFVRRYCNAYKDSYGWNMSGAAHLEELNDKLREVCFIRRLKSEVLKELPAKQRSEIMVELSNKAEYDRAEADVVNWIKERVKSDADFHRQIEHMPEEIQETIIANRADAKAASAAQAETLVRIESLKQLSAEGKMEAVGEWIEDFIDSGEKLVVFATHKTIVKRLAERFNADSITGDTPIEKRQAAVDRFQNDPESKVMVCNIQAGGVGITLTAASNVAFVELGWNPAAHDQAEDRCHRIGQTDSVTAYYFIGENSIDEWIYDLIEEKRVVVDAATDGVVREKRTAGMMKDLVKKLSKKGDEQRAPIEQMA